METREEVLKFFANYIQSELGIIYTDTNFFQLEHRLKDISVQLGYVDVEAFYQIAKSGIAGMTRSLLLDLATNNETSFFRDPAIYKALSEHVIPEILSRGPKVTLDIWSAASSSGQEPYSIAMELSELSKKNANLPMYKLLATDVSDTILKRAQNGQYSQLEVQRGLPAKLMVQYFDKVEDDQWKVKPSLQKDINFKKLNLLHEWGDIGTFDVVFIRNVLIYQNVENKKKVIAKVLERLRPGGHLFLGAAESLFGISDQFTQLSLGSAIVYKKKD